MGSWHKRPAAIKVMNTRHSDSEAVSDAMEMAVLSSVQHPNIVQVYSCLTDMIEAPSGVLPLPPAFGDGRPRPSPPGDLCAIPGLRFTPLRSLGRPA
jgi:hypothetical protein